VSRVGGQLAAGRRRATDRPHLFHIDAGGVLRGLAAPPPGALGRWEQIRLPQADGLPFGTEMHPPGALALGYRQRGAQFDVFTVDRDGMLRVYSAAASGAWSADVVPEATGIPPGAGLATGYQRGGEVLDVFAAGRGGELLMYQCAGGERWRASVLPMEGMLPHGANLATAYQADGALTVYSVSRDGFLQVLGELAGGGWNASTYPDMQLPAGAPLATGYGADGVTPSVFVVNSEGMLCELRTAGPGAGSGSAAAGRSGFGWSRRVLPGDGLRPPAVVATAYGDRGRPLVFVIDDAGRLRQYAAQPDGGWSVGLLPGGAGLPPGAPLAVGYRENGAVIDLFTLPGFSAPPVIYTAVDGRWTGPRPV
jgi:hypothetical protein